MKNLGRLVFRYEPLRQWRTRYFDDWLRHPEPIDVEYRIHTSGTIASEVLYGSVSGATDRNYYIGSRPSHSQALTEMADPRATIVLNLCCGKGRVLVVASEFPFAEIIGIELSPAVAAIAEGNVAIGRRRFPERSPIRVITGDAAESPLPEGPLGLFIFHPFGEKSVRVLIARIEDALRTRCHQSITVIYYNPVCGALFDSSPWLVLGGHPRCIPLLVLDDFCRRC